MASTRNSNNYRKPKKNEAPPEQVIIEGIFKALGTLVVMIFRSLTGGGAVKKGPTNRQEIEKLREHWQDVEMYALQENTHAMAISEGDKILDSAFKALGLKGETMADRLRAAETRLGQDLYQRVWEAHKLRNTLAHEVGAKATAQEAERAVTTFRQALYQLGILS